MDLLPPDMLYKIVLPFPIKCLVRFRCACKIFYTDPIIVDRVEKLIEEPNILLVTSFSTGSRGSDEKPRYEEDAAAGFLKVSIPQAKVRPSLSPPALLGSCDGLMMFEGDPGVCFLVSPLREEALIPWLESPVSIFDDDIQRRLIFCSVLVRPDSIGQYRSRDWLSRRLTFSPTEECWCASGLGLDHVTGEYKFVLVSMSIGITMVHVLGTGSWRRIGSPSSRPSGRGIFIGGTLYWPRNRPMVGLVTFDIAKEEYDYISCPNSSGVMVELGNSLGVTDISPEGLANIWELDVHTKDWAKKYEVDFLLLANLRCPPGFLERHFLDVHGMWNQKIVFKFESTLYSYDPQSRSIEPVQHPRLDSHTMPYCIRGGPVSPFRFKPLTAVFKCDQHLFCFSDLTLI